MKFNLRQQNRSSEKPKRYSSNGENGVSFWRIVISFAIIAFLVTAATSYFMYWIMMRNGEIINFRSDSELGPMYALPEFVVNLSDPNWPRYIRLKVILEVKNKRVLKEMEERSPQIRDKVISVIRDKTVKDIQSSQGFEELRRELKRELDSIIGTDKINNLYFDGFVIQ